MELRLPYGRLGGAAEELAKELNSMLGFVQIALSKDTRHLPPVWNKVGHARTAALQRLQNADDND